MCNFQKRTLGSEQSIFYKAWSQSFWDRQWSLLSSEEKSRAPSTIYGKVVCPNHEHAKQLKKLALSEFRHTAKELDVARCIPIEESKKPNSLIEANFLDREFQKELLFWRLGRIAYHQNCNNCRSSKLSRKHAVQCSNIQSVLEPIVDTTLPSFNAEMTLLDNAMNQTPVTQQNIEKLKKIVFCIETIKMKCLGWIRNEDGVLTSSLLV